MTQGDRLGLARHHLIRATLSLAGLGAVIGLLELVSHTAGELPNAGTFLVAAVAVMTYAAGLSTALVGTAVSVVYLTLSLHPWSQGAMAATRDDIERVISFAASAVILAALIGHLRQRSERRIEREHEHAERMRQLEQTKSEFLRVASHELRGPLAVARGYASMLEDGSFGPLEAADVRRAAPTVSRKLLEMGALVESMLDTARLEEHRLALQREPVDLRDIVQRAVDSVLPDLTPRHEVLWAPPPHPVMVLGDAARLAIVVTNLTSNAVKYSPGGGVIQCFCGVSEGRAVVSVWDQGLGIAAEDLPTLFSRFGRLVTKENSHISGTGLGLYLARELARLHGGDVEARSAVGRGSTFTLSLPLLDQAPQAQPGRPEPRSPRRRADVVASTATDGGPRPSAEEGGVVRSRSPLPG